MSTVYIPLLRSLTEGSRDRESAIRIRRSIRQTVTEAFSSNAGWMRVGNASTIIKSKRQRVLSDVTSPIASHTSASNYNETDKRPVKFAINVASNAAPRTQYANCLRSDKQRWPRRGHDKGMAGRSIKIIARRRARCVAVSIFASSRAAELRDTVKRA